MVDQLQVPLSYAGIISMIISCGTITSSLFSDKLTHRFGAGIVTAVSISFTALALLGFSLCNSFPLMCLLAIPYGLGAGAVDAALNNYVALHYAARHMNWLHCFWGVGASIGPYIMGWVIQANHGWRMGYGVVSGIQILLAISLFFTLPLWQRQTGGPVSEKSTAPISLRKAVSLRGVKEVLLAFFCYCAFESTAILWASTYLVEFKAVDPEQAATFASLFLAGITLGRFISGFVADRIGDKNMMRIGITVIVLGLALIMLPVSAALSALLGLILIGLGAAPIYPAIIHSTPTLFGKENSHAVVGIQMASAYCGSLLMPPAFGILAQYVHIGIFPFYMAMFVVIMLWMTERANRLCKY
jgi:fucose permease